MLDNQPPDINPNQGLESSQVPKNWIFPEMTDNYRVLSVDKSSSYLNISLPRFEHLHISADRAKILRDMLHGNPNNDLDYLDVMEYIFNRSGMVRDRREKIVDVDNEGKIMYNTIDILGEVGIVAYGFSCGQTRRPSDINSIHPLIYNNDLYDVTFYTTQNEDDEDESDVPIYASDGKGSKLGSFGYDPDGDILSVSTGGLFERRDNEDVQSPAINIGFEENKEVTLYPLYPDDAWGSLIRHDEGNSFSCLDKEGKGFRFTYKIQDGSIVVTETYSEDV